MNNLASLKNQVDTIPIGQFTSQESIRNRAVGLLGKDRALKFLTGITSAVSTNPSLSECTNTSIFNGALLGETLNLSPSPQLGHYYLVPFKKYKMVNGKRELDSVTAQFQLGYKGYIQLAIRSGQYKKINVVEVKEGEFTDYDIFNEEYTFNPIKDYNARKQAKTVGYYAMFEYLNGFKKSLYMSKDEMLDHADTYSSAFNKKSYADLIEGKIPERELYKYSSFWYKNFDEMAKKTMLRQLISKWGIMSTEMQKAFEADMAELDDNGKPTYIDNPGDKIPEAPITEKPTETPSEEPKEVKQVDINEL